MIIIAKRMKALFVIGLVSSIVLFISGIILLIIAKDGSTTIPAIVIFIIVALLLLLALIDKFKMPNNLIMYDENRQELLIDRLGKITISKKIDFPADSKYYIIPIANITNVVCCNQPEGGTGHFGALGYMLSVKSVNHLAISFIINESEVTLKIINLNDVKKVTQNIVSLRTSNNPAKV